MNTEIFGGSVLTFSLGLYLVGAFVYLKALSDADQDKLQVSRGMMAIGMGVGAAACFVLGSNIGGTINSLLAMFWAWQWWNNRRNGKWENVLKAWGEKTRAKIQAMVKRMTPSPTPSPTKA